MLLRHSAQYPMLILISSYPGVCMEIITHWEVLKKKQEIGKKMQFGSDGIFQENISQDK